MNPESVKRYPLEWPVGWKRCRNKRVGKFQTVVSTTDQFGTHRRGRAISMEDATRRLEKELDRLGAKNPTLSTNVSLRLDGRPRGDVNPSDPGASVYFTYKGRATVLACDTYFRVADNIAALAAHLESLRAIERYGVGTIEQALAGYKALPADTASDWRSVFGFPANSRPTVDQVDKAFKAAAKERHPDVGGNELEMSHLNRARDYALMELEA